MKISKINARQILDSRGNPTVEVDVNLDDGSFGRASIPSGASTGEREAIELRDSDSPIYNGKGVMSAVNNVNRVIAPALIGKFADDQIGIDNLMISLDGTFNKGRLGANAVLGVSLAVAKAAAVSLKTPLFRYLGGPNAHILPIPMMNIINAGAHSDAPISFQEFMIRPIGARSFSHALQMGVEIFHTLKSRLKSRGFNTAVGDEGGFAPMFKSVSDVLDTMLLAIERSGYRPGVDVSLALDCAASEFFRDGIYDYSIKQSGGAKLSSSEQAQYLRKLVDTYPIDSIEDGMDQNDWVGWASLTSLIGDRCQLVGDDLFVTNTEYLQKGISLECANAILIKPNQIGTLTETLQTIDLARRNGYSTIISHRSGETEDSTIADIAVAPNAGQIKTGSVTRSDRLAKYNQLLRIEELLGDQAQYGH